MSTSIKELTGFEIIFKRPVKILGWLLALLMIYYLPFYNTVLVAGGSILYLIMYQNRKLIYKMGIARFDFLAFLIYISVWISFFINWEYKDIGTLNQLSNLSIWSLFTDGAYQDQVKNWLTDNLDSLIHWKMLIFSPAMAAIFYIIFVELDRKTVKDTDLQTLGLSRSDLFKTTWMLDGLGYAVFLFASLLFGWHCFVAAIMILVAFNYLRVNLYAICALIVAVVVLVLNYAHFNYLVFLSLPHQLMEIFTHYSGQGLGTYFKVYLSWSKVENYGQWYILVPYLLLSGLTSWLIARNRVEIGNNMREEETKREIATTIDALEFALDIATRKTVRLTHKELNFHMYVNGASGSGKTVAMLSFVIDAAQKRLPLIYIDGKGSTDLEDKMAKIAIEYGRTFKVFTLSPSAVLEASPYDFLGAGTFTEKKNRIMNLFQQGGSAGADYFMDNLETFINRVFMLIEKQKLKIDLFRFLTLISNINDLIELAEHDIVMEDGSKINHKAYFESIRDMKPEQSPRMRIITKLDPFIHSSYGYLFNVIGKSNVINIKQSIKNGEIVLFLFDASAFELDTERVAKMVISDINATFAEFGKEKTPIKTFCCFDEFKSYETDAIGKTISLHRSNGMHAIIGTQSLALIDKEIGDGILANCQTHLVMTSADEDAERFTREFGETERVESTTRVKADVQEVSDISTRRVTDFVIKKQEIKDIMVGTGKGYLHRKAVGAKPIKVQVIKKT